MYTYDTLNTGARRRLALYRGRAQKSNYAKDWRCHRCENLKANTSNQLRYSDDGEAAYCDESLADGWRSVGTSPELLSHWRDVGGWYADACDSNTYTGHVWQLPARNGEPQYVAGYKSDEGEGHTLDATRGKLSVFDSKEDAAQAGNELARIHAEREREHSERWQEANMHDQEREAAREELQGARHDARMVVRAWREQRATGPLAESVCELMKERLETAREQMRDAINSIRRHSEAIISLDMDGEI